MLFAVYLGFKEQKRIKKAIERNELPTQDIDVHKLVEVYELINISFLEGTCKNKIMEWVEKPNFSCYSIDVNKYCAT